MAVLQFGRVTVLRFAATAVRMAYHGYVGVQSGEVTAHDDADAFLDHLDALGRRSQRHVKFETTPALAVNYKRLEREHQATFRSTVRDKFAPACDIHAGDASRPWPASLRVKSVRNAPGILEMMWSFASPDGRATFELLTIAEDMRASSRVGHQAV